jgi:hypothetical protein
LFKYEKQKYFDSVGSDKMDTKIINVIFEYGRKLWLTPHSDSLSEKPTRLEKFYSFLIFTLLASCVNFYFFGIRLVNTTPLSAEYILVALLLVTYVMHDIYVFIIILQVWQMVRDGTMSGTCALPQKQISVVPFTICHVTTSGIFVHSCWHLHLFIFLHNKARGWYSRGLY